MEVRKRSLCMAGDEVLGAPLFSGRCFIRRRVESREQALKSALVNLTLELNPTRFVVHQWPQDSTKRQGVNLLKHQLPYGVGAEYALDLGSDGRKPSDNWLPDKPHFVRHSQGKAWRGMLKAYLDVVFKAIGSEFKTAAKLATLSAPESGGRQYKLNSVETYWEFSSLDPIKLVYDLVPLVAAFGERENSLRHYPKIRRRDELKHHHNSPVLSILVRDGVSLVIYAKTNRRVRFEVRHDLKRLKPPLGGIAAKVAKRRELLPLFDALSEDAAKVVNSLLSFMRGKKSYSGASVSPLGFLAKFASVTQGMAGANGLLSMLIHNGRLVMDAGIREAVLALREAGLIVSIPRNNRRAHEIAPKYRKAVELLKKADLPVTGVRDRNRKR